MQEINEVERNAIDKMRRKIIKDLRSHLVYKKSIDIGTNLQSFYWLGLEYDRDKIMQFILEALQLATKELQEEFKKDAEKKYSGG